MKPELLGRPPTRRKRRRISGKLQPVKNEESATNAKPTTVSGRHFGKSVLFREARRDGRGRGPRREKRQVSAMVAELGRAPLTLERLLFENAAKLNTLADYCISHIERSGRIDGAAPDTVVKCARELLAVAESLGALPGAGNSQASLPHWAIAQPRVLCSSTSTVKVNTETPKRSRRT